jgi:hypothetical protein
MMLRNILGGWLFLWGRFAEIHHDQSDRGFVYFRDEICREVLQCLVFFHYELHEGGNNVRQ